MSTLIIEARDPRVDPREGDVVYHPRSEGHYAEVTSRNGGLVSYEIHRGSASYAIDDADLDSWRADCDGWRVRR